MAYYRLMDWHVARNATLAERLEFYSIPEPNSGCLLWTAGANACGYGVIGIRKQSTLAHRVAWAVAFGPVPDEVEVCHKCDVPSCINVAHLYLGTHQDNMDDKVARGRARSAPGERSPHAKLTNEQVLAIRSDPRFLRVIAAEYGIGKSLVSVIRRREVWKHLV